MKNNVNYHEYASYIVSEIPSEAILTDIIDSLYFEAALNMGARTEGKDNSRDVNRIVYLIKTDFNYLPIPVIASAFMKGSLGKLDTGRLIPRTVFNWISEVAGEYRRQKDHTELQEKLKDKPLSFDLHKYPVGQAINKKIDWLKSGAITNEDYDKIPLKELAKRIASGMLPVPELFGVKTKNKEAL